MTSHVIQISNIINNLTSYEGSYYPKVPSINGVNFEDPKFLVKEIPGKHTNDHVQLSNFFTVECKADTHDNLETQIAAILNLSGNALGGGMGATATVTYTVTFWQDDHGAKGDESTKYAGTDGRFSSSNFDSKYHKLRLKSDYGFIQDGTISAASLTVTAGGNTGDDSPHFTIYGYKGNVPNPTNTTKAVWEVNNTTTFFEHPNPAFSNDWDLKESIVMTTSDEDSFIDITQEIIDAAGYDGVFGFLIQKDDTVQADLSIYALDEAGMVDEPIPILSVSYTISGYPFYLQFTLIDKDYSNNEFRALIECEGRWAL